MLKLSYFYFIYVFKWSNMWTIAIYFEYPEVLEGLQTY